MGHLDDLGEVVRGDAAAVLDGGPGGAVARQFLGHEGMDLADLLDGGHAAGADRPHGLVGDHQWTGTRLLEHGQLLAQHVEHLPAVTLLQRFPDAEDGHEAVLAGRLHLLHEVGVGLAEDVPALAVAQEHTVAADVLELGHGDLAGEGALGLEVGVLGIELDTAGAELRLHVLEVDVGRGDAGLDAGLGLVAGHTRGAEGLDVLGEEVHLPVGDDDAHGILLSVLGVKDRDARELQAAEVFEARAAARGHVAHAGRHAGLVGGGDAVAAAEQDEGAPVGSAGHGLGHAQGPGGEEVHLEDAHGAVP